MPLLYNISSLTRQMLSAVTFLSMFTAVDTFPESLWAEAENGKTGFLLMNQFFFCYVRLIKKKKLINTVTFGKNMQAFCSW